MNEYTSFGADEHGALTMGGVSLQTLAKKYATPFYVMDEDKIRANCREYTTAMKSNIGDNFVVSYASKAFCAKYIYKVMKEEGLHADVVSAGELFTAMSAGFDPSHLHFHGNNKTPDEIKYALECGIESFVVDNLVELETLNKLAGAQGTKAKITLRIKPGVDAHTHEFVQTGKIDSKFGFAFETGEALDAAKAAIELENIDFQGIHCHIGSQIFDKEPFGCAIDVMFDLITQISQATGVETRELNLGGGFGMSHGAHEIPVPIAEMMEYICSSVKAAAQAHTTSVPRIVLEPGRSIVGNAGATVYTVGNVKTIPNVRKYIAIDGGMTDNPRFALYGANYEISRVRNCAEEKTECVTVAGKCCESGDLITQNSYIQPVEVGDLVCVFATGAYTFSMASNYNRLLRPPVVVVQGGKDKIIVSRQTLDQLIHNDL